MLSDLHLGKIEHFRKHGIALPRSASEYNYEKLQKVIDDWCPDRVIFLGDLFHSSANSAWSQFQNFIKDYTQVHFELVLGNHDILGIELFADVLDEIHSNGVQVDNFHFSHYPESIEKMFNFCGHIHPAIKLTGGAKTSVSLSCFAFSKGVGILPAFGTFTGTHFIDPHEFIDVFMIAEDEVIQFKQ